MTSGEGSTSVKLTCGSIATGATLYSGAVHIPICYGSVAIPTPSPQRSHLYRRICYLRDGADLPLDAYYRWRWSQEASLRQLSQQQQLACSSAAGSRKKRDRSESSADHQSTRSLRHMGTLCSPAPSSHNEKETEVLVESPSPLYAMLDHVDFVLPKSFPHTRRSVFEPPFMVEDDTWAEHMVEIHLFFKAELLILPMILLHPCRLYPSDSVPPRFSPPSPATAASNGTIPVKKRHAEESSVSGTGSTEDRDDSHGRAVLQTIVSERKDAIRIFHPSVGVVHFLNGVHAFAQKSFSEAEYQHFLQSVYCNKKQMPQGGGAERWRLRHEEEIETYARGRFERSLATLRNVVADLRQEQEDLVDNVSTTMARIIEEAYKVQLMMNAIHGIVVCGPSGVGKGTLLWRLMKEYSSRFGFSVSHTSRPPRDHEVDGVDYHFVDEKTILELNRTNNLIEMGYIHGKYYATSVAAFKKVQDEGKVCILEIDVNAVETIQKVPDLNAVYVFVSAPREDLRTRIVRRGSCTEKDVETRLKTAEYELDFLEHHPDYFQCVVENIDCDLAYHQLVDFLQMAFIAHGMKEL